MPLAFPITFEAAYTRLIGHEGGYSDHPEDRGGETYKGVSRRFNPGWPGWGIIDACKGSENLADCLAHSNTLEDQVKAFYKTAHWDPFDGDNLPYDLAYELFEIGVNMGVSTACKFLQQTLNAFNQKGRFWEDLIVDGKPGPKTVRASRIMAGMKNRHGAKVLTKALNCLQGHRYIEITQRDPSQEVFAWGWFARV